MTVEHHLAGKATITGPKSPEASLTDRSRIGTLSSEESIAVAKGSGSCSPCRCWPRVHFSLHRGWPQTPSWVPTKPLVDMGVRVFQDETQRVASGQIFQLGVAAGGHLSWP